MQRLVRLRRRCHLRLPAVQQKAVGGAGGTGGADTIEASDAASRKRSLRSVRHENGRRRFRRHWLKVQHGDHNLPEIDLSVPIEITVIKDGKKNRSP